MTIKRPVLQWQSIPTRPVDVSKHPQKICRMRSVRYASGAHRLGCASISMGAQGKNRENAGEKWRRPESVLRSTGCQSHETGSRQTPVWSWSGSTGTLPDVPCQRVCSWNHWGKIEPNKKSQRLGKKEDKSYTQTKSQECRGVLPFTCFVNGNDSVPVVRSIK